MGHRVIDQLWIWVLTRLFVQNSGTEALYNIEKLTYETEGNIYIIDMRWK